MEHSKNYSKVMSKICFAVGWEDIINSYPENNERI